MSLRLFILSFLLLLNTACEGGGGGAAAGGGGGDTSTVARLSALTLSSGTLSPAFATGSFSYTASVANGVSSITVTPTKTTFGASIHARVNAGTYTIVSSGNASDALSLDVGPNTIDIRVTAADTTTTQVYSVVVTRAGSSVATLSALTHNNSAVFTPTFASGTVEYSMAVLNATTSITVTPTVTQANATIAVRINSSSDLDYVAVASGAASASLALNVGSNPINIRVTAQDTTTIQTYTLDVIRSDTPKKIFVAGEDSVTDNDGNLGGIAGADVICNTASNRPPGLAVYKAMLSDGTNRVACTTSNCSGGTSEHVDWVLSPNTEYETLNSDLVGITNANGIFTFPLTTRISVEATGPAVWTGLNASFTSSANDCSGFTSTAGTGPVGSSDNTDSTAINFSLVACSTQAYLYCVEQ